MEIQKINCLFMICLFTIPFEQIIDVHKKETVHFINKILWHLSSSGFPQILCFFLILIDWKVEIV